MRINNKHLSGNYAKAYAIAIGNISMQRKYRKSNHALAEIIKSLDGLCGVMPYYPHGTLIIFNSEYNAKSAKNILESKGVHTGNNITPVDIPIEYAITTQ